MGKGICEHEQYGEWDSDEGEGAETSFSDLSELLARLVLVNAFEENGGADGDEEENAPPNILHFAFLIVEGLRFCFLQGVRVGWEFHIGR